MSTIPAAALLQAWEEGRVASPGERGLILLRVAYPETPVAVLADWTVGQRDAALLSFFEHEFGSPVAALTECPSCNESLEIDIPVAAINSPRTQGEMQENLFALEHAGFRVIYRLPTAGDLAALNASAAALNGRPLLTHWLLKRCVKRVEQQDEADCATAEKSHGEIAADLPDILIQQLEAAIADVAAKADPQADIELSLTCPACAMRWRTRFDVVSFLWEEIDTFAERLLGEVHMLAYTYGWSERDILALSPRRRRHYLDLIGE